MSRRSDCWDNAPMESFFASLKKELVHGADFATRAEARAALVEYIEVFYNTKRRHSSLGYVSPAEYERTQKLNLVSTVRGEFHSHAAEMEGFIAQVRATSGWRSVTVPIGNGEFVALKPAQGGATEPAS